MENIGTSVRNLMNSDELIKLDNNIEIIIERGRKPIKCRKYDYSKHEEAHKLEDITIGEQRKRFKENLEIENTQKKKQEEKRKLTFKDF